MSMGYYLYSFPMMQVKFKQAPLEAIRARPAPLTSSYLPSFADINWILILSAASFYGAIDAQTVSNEVCPGFEWGVVVELIKEPPYPVYDLLENLARQTLPWGWLCSEARYPPSMPFMDPFHGPFRFCTSPETKAPHNEPPVISSFPSSTGSFVLPWVPGWTICPSLQPSDKSVHDCSRDINSLTGGAPTYSTPLSSNYLSVKPLSPMLHGNYTMSHEAPEAATSSKVEHSNLHIGYGSDNTRESAYCNSSPAHVTSMEQAVQKESGITNLSRAPSSVSSILNLAAPAGIAPGQVQLLQKPIIDPCTRSASPVSNISHTSRNSTTSRASYRRFSENVVPRCASPHKDLVYINGRRPPSLWDFQLMTWLFAFTVAAVPSSNIHPSESTETVDFSRVHPISSYQLKRYDKEGIISSHKHYPIIPALTTKYPDYDQTLQPGWAKASHPGGAFYFLHSEQRIFAEVNIWNSDIHMDVCGFADYLQNELRRLISQNESSPSLAYDEVELVLEPGLAANSDNILCHYYFVNPHNQCLFWLHDFDATPIMHNCKGVDSLSHKKLAIHAEYWLHWQLFPNFCHLSQATLDYLKEMMLYARCDRDIDHLTCPQSVEPYDAIELENLYRIVSEIKPNNSNLKDQTHSIWIVGRLMHQFARNSFLNFHGQAGSRLEFQQSIYGQSYKRSNFMSILSPLFFYTPDIHVRALHGLFVDHIVSSHTWSKFIDKLNNELQDQNLLATVLLNANVGFLAINSVDNGSGPNDTSRSATQLASYFSLVASLGSIISGLVLFRHTRTKAQENALKQAGFLSKMSHERYGLEKLAIVYSLPFALLMWGMLCFFSALSMECYTSKAKLPNLFVGSFSIAVIALMAWCIHALWAEQDKLNVTKAQAEIGDIPVTTASVVHDVHVFPHEPERSWHTRLRDVCAAAFKRRTKPLTKSEVEVELQSIGGGRSRPVIKVQRATSTQGDLDGGEEDRFQV
ncbi:hypothetical protein SERLA73DRAFT_69655 [Serpula lacrymans var. lacrymans S7.3]|uniref:Uncharacterized protein n=1 Tax=Serpula lacrymans var. lacrymans (strain S7.3) TaxID=936435 RepID=F8PKB1_SERL3|nr:hypothetical protein SERLA73DRAFT_69655 [Serpula lacrymans var. lacrymans S7.3]